MRMPSAAETQRLISQISEWHARADEVMPYLNGRGLSRRAAERFSLGFDGERLTIPYLHPMGAWFVKRRCVASHDCKAEGCPKYLGTEGHPLRLYNAQTLLTADRVVIVEGELDAVSVEMAGVPAVAFPGAGAWKSTKSWRWCFDSCDEVIVVADGDAPKEGKTVGVGEEAARAVAESLRSSLPDVEVRLVVMPVGHDSNSYINSEGQMAFLELIGWI